MVRKRAKVLLSIALISLLTAVACLSSTTQIVITETPSVQQPAQQPEQPGGGDDGSGETMSGGEDMLAMDNMLSPNQVDEIIRASVQIFAVSNAGNFNENNIIWTGSGTIISPDGTIVTNCHVACGAPQLVVALTDNPDLPPTPTYIAEISSFTEAPDLAILRIVSDMNGNSVAGTTFPFINVGNSDDLQLGDPVRVFGYPGVGGATITFTSGSISGFESDTLPGTSGPQRRFIKTDADIAGGNSGGTAVDDNGNLIGIPTAVNPEVRGDATIGAIGIMLPVNLIGYVQNSGSNTPPPVAEGALPPTNEPDPNEPNDDFNQAVGPLVPGNSVNGFISWAEDIDVYFFTTETNQPIQVEMTGPSGVDYDMYLFDRTQEVVGLSESEISDEFIEFNPSGPGTFWVAVLSFDGVSTSTPYSLTVNYDGGNAGQGSGIVVSGTAVFADSGSPISGGIMGVLDPSTNCDTFFNSPNFDESLLVAEALTDSSGVFRLVGLPRGSLYSAFFIVGQDFVCEDGWLDIPSDGIDTDLGVIEIFL